jgi:hypothetical protein
VRREQRPEQRDRDQEGDDPHTDLRARQPQRVAQDPEPRPALEDRAGADGLDGGLEADVYGGVDGGIAHRAAVLSFGVTRIVARSAIRFMAT